MNHMQFHKETPYKQHVNKKRFRSAQIIPLGFLAAIAVGTSLLMLPFSTAPGNKTDFLTALFTATTSVCVTGLVVVDTFIHWSLFGKIVILLLIQLGGLGIVAVFSLLILLFRKKMSLRQTVIVHDSFNLNSLNGLRQFLVKVFIGTFIVEGAGAILYMFVFIPRFGVPKGIWYSVFTAISAFCNAGIDILGPDSLISYQCNKPVLLITMLLIVLGGLGYIVWFDIISGIKNGIRKKAGLSYIYKRFSEHTRLVLFLTAFLILTGAGMVFILEFHNPDTIGRLSLPDKIFNSLFQSITFRTAGFASVPQQFLSDSTCVGGALFMFIGGSPIGTAGGIKTVTFFVVIANTAAYIGARDETVVFKRRLSEELIKKASAITAVSFMITLFMLVLLSATNHISLTDGLFEIVSATATVGLSRSLTPLLNPAGKWIIIICMYLGRIGPISMALFFSKSWSSKNSVSFSKENFYVG